MIKQERIELNPYIEDLIHEVMEKTTLKRQDIINWFVNEGYDDYFYYNDTNDLIGLEFSEYKKGD